MSIRTQNIAALTSFVTGILLLGLLFGPGVLPGHAGDDPGSPGEELEVRYPDLVTLPPHDIRLEELPWRKGGPYLRFGNSILNQGEGPLELRAAIRALEDRILVYQRVYGAGGSAAHTLQVGRFVHHAAHDHWHMADFVRYEIWSLTPEGDLDRRLSSSGKISYCVMDVYQAEDHQAAGERPGGGIYLSCSNRRQGLSVGWIDTYHYWYDGQSLDVGDFPPGTYALRSVADPDDLVREMDEDNNEAVVYFRIDGLEITVFDSRSDLPRTNTNDDSPLDPLQASPTAPR